MSPKKPDPQLDPEAPGSPAWYLAQAEKEWQLTVPSARRNELGLVTAYYRLGLSREIPTDWQLKYGHLTDPEWAEYQRLKEKFGEA